MASALSGVEMFGKRFIFQVTRQEHFVSFFTRSNFAVLAFPSHPTMAASHNRLDEAILGLSHNDTTLTTLFLRNNQVGDEEAWWLAEALATNSTLTTLDLRMNQVGDEGTRRLAEALTINSSLTTLNLRGNQVGDEGIVWLAEALATNTPLINLHLSSNQVGAEGAGRLAEALPFSVSTPLQCYPA